ncbi:anti-virulence regulator CigR family protein [Halopseudomonas bauzanensis]|uniref:anti-virulence regulator CigR family protein n=1 Tax=Halopseudomonas bauzanensis TaxID=653930 RepID=UPI0025544C3D|nr:anti-virulence regulator CigR family protein [Halopseudomonas bauzanensis]
MQHRLTVLACLLTASLCVPQVYAGPPEDKGPPHHRSANHGHPGKGNSGRDHRHHREERRQNRDALDVLVSAGISAVLAREYARDVGLAGYRDLPPGIRKNLMRGKPLPPGIARKVRSDRFLDRLPRHTGYEWQMAGTDLILVSVATGVIADILLDVFD